MDWWTKDPDPWSRNWEGGEIEDDDSVPPEPIFRVQSDLAFNDFVVV
jgi:hypothetical protein